MAVPELWRTTRQRYSLRAEICPHCEEAVFPPRAVCPHCRREVRMSVQVNQQFNHTAPATTPVREFIYGLPAHLAGNINTAIHAAMQSNGAHLIAAGDD